MLENMWNVLTILAVFSVLGTVVIVLTSFLFGEDEDDIEDKQ